MLGYKMHCVHLNKYVFNIYFIRVVAYEFLFNKRCTRFGSILLNCIPISPSSKVLNFVLFFKRLLLIIPILNFKGAVS